MTMETKITTKVIRQNTSDMKKKAHLPDVRPLNQRNIKVPYEILNEKVHHLIQHLKIKKSERFPHEKTN